jgi:mRNA-degrading endonuclease RelE of RelBE toxin-antitoxin system
VVKYSLEIKQSAQKELDALDDPLFMRIDVKILALADNPRPAGCKKLKGYTRISGAFESVTGACCISSMTRRNS